MALKLVSFILTTVILQAELSSSFLSGFPFPKLPGIPGLSGFHRLLSKNQLMKYFNVRNYDDVPEYEFVDIGLKILDPFYWGEKFANISSGNAFEPQDTMIISAQSIFGYSVQMELRRNDKLLAPSFKVIQMEDDDVETELVDSFPMCHYIGVNGSITAALSSCQYTSVKGLSGIFILPNESVQIQPIDQELASLLGLLDNQLTRFLMNSLVEIMHLVFKPKKISSGNEERWDDEISIPFAAGFGYDPDDREDEPQNSVFDDFSFFSDNMNKEYTPWYFSGRERRSYPTSGRQRQGPPKTFYAVRSGRRELYLELAIFFDQAGYETFMPLMKSEKSLRELILGLVNQVQAVYKQPSLSRKIQIRIVRLEYLKKQPVDLPHANGQQDLLMTAFCNYQSRKNPVSDKNPNHWDMALYLSALDLHTVEEGVKLNLGGVAYFNQVCTKSACAVVKFGTANDDGTPTISSGFYASYTVAHEMGHSLGLYHDGHNNNCPTEGYVMGPSVSPSYMTWSSCSLNALEKLNKKCLLDVPQAKPRKNTDHTKYNEKPGKVWDAHQQCKIFLKDDYATLRNERDISSVCNEIWCKSRVDQNNQYKIVSAGAALEGTYCGYQKWCQRGKCVPMKRKNAQKRRRNRNKH